MRQERQPRRINPALSSPQLAAEGAGSFGGNITEDPKTTGVFGAMIRNTTVTPRTSEGHGKIIGPTQEEADAANRDGLAPKGLTKKLTDIAKNPVFKAAAGTVVVAGGVTAAYQAIPAIHQSVDSLGQAAAERWNSMAGQETFEERFPIVLSQENFTLVTPEEEKELWKNTKTVDLENHTFTLGFPASQAVIDQSPNLRMNSYFEPALFAGVDTSTLQQEGLENVNQLSGFPKDAPIGLNYNPEFDASIIEIGIAGVKQGDGANSFTPAYTNYRIIFRDRQTGKEYEQSISILYAKPLIDAAKYPKNHHPTYADGSPIKPGMPFVQLTTDLQDWDGITGQVLPGQKGQVMLDAIAGGIDEKTSRIIVLTPVFLKDPTGHIASQQ